MIEFKSLQSGLYYYTNCPLCGNHMRIDCLESQYAYNNRGYTITFGLEGDDKLIINPVTEEIVIQYYQKVVYQDRSYLSGSCIDDPVVPVTNTYNGALYHGVTVSCSKGGCTNFSYTLKLLIDLNRLRLKNIALSNMKIYLKKGLDTCEISNYFNLNKTTFGYSVANGGKFVELPLIDINLENPQETLARIEKLLIFT